MLNQLTISEAIEGLRAKKFSAREVMQSCIDRVKQVDGKVKAFLSYDEQDALTQADAADKILGGGKGGPLTGIPMGIKDVLCVKDHPCNCASKILGNFRSPYDGTAIQKLKAAGAVMFGRTNMDEFAMGSSTENSAFFTTRNPWDLERIPG
jgi:aspartyl-tRNA(Asn)/glutamyl-tRNA(Gln) amidotransferase subunit A